MVTYTIPIEETDADGIEKAIKNAKNNMRINSFLSIPIIIILQLVISYRIMGEINFSPIFFFISGLIYFFFIYVKDKAVLDKVIADSEAGEKGVYIFQIAEKTENMRSRYKVFTKSGNTVEIPFRTLNKQEFEVGNWVRVSLLPNSQAIIGADVVEKP